MIASFGTEEVWLIGPWRSFDDKEFATLTRMAVFNTEPLLGPLDYVPPAEYEEQYSRDQALHAA